MKSRRKKWRPAAGLRCAGECVLLMVSIFLWGCDSTSIKGEVDKHVQDKMAELRRSARSFEISLELPPSTSQAKAQLDKLEEEAARAAQDAQSMPAPKSSAMYDAEAKFRQGLYGEALKLFARIDEPYAKWYAGRIHWGDCPAKNSRNYPYAPDLDRTQALELMSGLTEYRQGVHRHTLYSHLADNAPVLAQYYFRLGHYSSVAVLAADIAARLEKDEQKLQSYQSIEPVSLALPEDPGVMAPEVQKGQYEIELAVHQDPRLAEVVREINESNKEAERKAYEARKSVILRKIDYLAFKAESERKLGMERGELSFFRAGLATITAASGLVERLLRAFPNDDEVIGMQKRVDKIKAQIEAVLGGR